MCSGIDQARDWLFYGVYSLSLSGYIITVTSLKGKKVYLVHCFSPFWGRQMFMEVDVVAEASPVKVNQETEHKAGPRVWTVTFKGLSGATCFLPSPSGPRLLPPPLLLQIVQPAVEKMLP